MSKYNEIMKKKWEELYDETLLVFPFSKYYIGADFVEKFENNKSKFLKYFDIIEKSYSIGRYYHTLFHVNEVLNALEYFSLSEIDEILLKYSIWFHDIIYDSKRNDNEKESGNLFYDFAVFFGLGHDFGTAVKKLIQVTDHKSNNTVPLGKIICDCDLYGFVAKNYIDRSTFVKKEYDYLSDEEWREGRKQFLQNILSRDYIYHTQKFRYSFETIARKHLQAELNYILSNE